jgi:hypothetical protein
MVPPNAGSRSWGCSRRTLDPKSTVHGGDFLFSLLSFRSPARGKKPQERAWGNLRSGFTQILPHEFCGRAESLSTSPTAWLVLHGGVQSICVLA